MSYKRLDTVDHLAICVNNVGQSVDWYKEKFHCEVAYQDKTWALLAFANVRLALVLPQEHPGHLAIMRPDAHRFGKLKTHRDGSRYLYLQDPAGNTVEILSGDGSRKTISKK